MKLSTDALRLWREINNSDQASAGFEIPMLDDDEVWSDERVNAAYAELRAASILQADGGVSGSTHEVGSCGTTGILVEVTVRVFSSEPLEMPHGSASSIAQTIAADLQSTRRDPTTLN